MEKSKIIKLYHGSYNPKGITVVKQIIPEKIHFGERSNLDFGPGFYLTPRYNQAMEWAVRKQSDGSLNSFYLDITNLKILNLDPYVTPPLYWIGELVYNRNFKEIKKEMRDFIIDNWRINTEGYDIILGYTADDNYNEIFKAFFKNNLSFIGLCKAVMLGNLGYQYVVRTKKGYKNLVKAGKTRLARKEYWLPKMYERYELADKYYHEIENEHSDYDSNELFFKKIIKYKIMPDDERVRFPFNEIKEDDRIDNNIFAESKELEENAIFPGSI